MTGTANVERGREVFGWVMYDWANSAFQTTVVTVLAGPYLTSLAQAAVGENGTVFDLGPFGPVTAKSLFPIVPEVFLSSIFFGSKLISDCVTVTSGMSFIVNLNAVIDADPLVGNRS